VACSPVARRWLDGDKVFPEISKGVTRKVPGKEERAGAHWNGASTVRRRKRRQAAAFIGGGVALVVIDMREGVLQRRCGRGKLRLAPIWEMARFGGRSPKRGGRRRRSDGVRRGRGAPVAENRRGGRLGYGNEGAVLGRGRARQMVRGVRKIFGRRAAAPF
jgi:hypothetical protein